MSEPLSLEEFTQILSDRFAEKLAEQADIAVGLSGGPDSMALLKLLSLWAEVNDGPNIHALIVDHGLREGSADEAALVQKRVVGWPQVTCEILSWNGAPEARIQEEARHGRYDLMAQYCAEQGIEQLFLGHHRDDQAETFLFRLAKGSGLDGLSAMKPAQPMKGMILMRPLLEISKDRLIATCQVHDLDVVDDPSNASEDFARVRLRKSMDVLAEEGLSAKRLAVTASRLARARTALEQIADDVWERSVCKEDTKHIVLNLKNFSGQPEEIALRIVIRCFERLCPGADYAPRMEKTETLVSDLIAPGAFRKRTLGGLVFERDDEAGQLKIQIEESV